jgi:hypothetical protein
MILFNRDNPVCAKSFLRPAHFDPATADKMKKEAGNVAPPDRHSSF